MRDIWVAEWRNGQNAQDTATATCSCDGKSIVPSSGAGRDLGKRLARPEAHYNLARLAAARQYEPGAAAVMRAQYQRAFLHFRVYLCLRANQRLPEIGNVWALAARGAEDAERALKGKTARWDPSNQPPPPPFLPTAILPAGWRSGTGDGPTPSATCEQVVQQSLHEVTAMTQGLARPTPP